MKTRSKSIAESSAPTIIITSDEETEETEEICDEMDKYIRLPLNLDGNVSENWRVFKQNFDVYAAAIELTKKAEAVQVAIFLNACGSEAIETFNTFDLTTENKSKYAEVVKAFQTYCEPKKNEVYEAFKFNSRNQETGETFDCFLLELKKLVKNCGYNNDDRMLRDRLVIGINDEN